MDRLLSTVDTAQMLGVSTVMLEAHRRKGTGIPFVKVGPGTTRYRLSDIEAYLTRNTFTSVDAAARDGHKIQGPKRK